MMRRRLSSCFRAQKPRRTDLSESDDLDPREDTYIQANTNFIQPRSVDAEETITTIASPQENCIPAALPVTDTEVKRVTSHSGQEQEDSILPATNSPEEDVEDGASELDEGPSHTKEAERDFDEDSNEIEPEWTILDADELADEYPNLVKLRDRSGKSNTSLRKSAVSGSWEILYNMAAAEVEHSQAGQELAAEGTDHQYGGENAQEGLKESEEDELELDTTLDDSASAKKKKFKPWKSIRNFFKKKRPGKEEGEGEESLGVKSKSTGELNRADTDEEAAEGDESTAPSLLSPSLAKGISVSEDSVFSPDKPAPTKEQVRISAEMNISNAFASELSAKLKRRSGSDDVIQKPAAEETVAKTPEHKPTPPKPAPRSSEKRRSTGMSQDDELSTRQRKPPSTKAKRSKSFTVARHEDRKQELHEEAKPQTTLPGIQDADTFDFDSIVSSSLLENTAARHRISVAPKARRATTRPGHRPAKRPVTTHEVPKTTETPSELTQPDLAPKRPKSAPLTAAPYTRPSEQPPPLPTAPIPSKRASTPKVNKPHPNDAKSSTVPRINTIPKTKRPPPIKLPRPPSLGPMVLPPISSSQSLKSGLKPTPPRSKSLGETPSGEALSPELGGTDIEPESSESVENIAETESLITSEMLTPEQPNTTQSPLSHSLMVPRPLSASLEPQETPVAIKISTGEESARPYPLGSPDPVTSAPKPSQDLIDLETGSEKRDESVGVTAAKKAVSPLMTELGNVLKRSGRSKTLGARPSSYGILDMPTPKSYSEIIDLASPEPVKPSDQKQPSPKTPSQMSESEATHSHEDIAKIRAQTLGAPRARARRPVSQPDMHFKFGGDMAVPRGNIYTQWGDIHVQAPPKPVRQLEKPDLKAKEEKVDFGVHLKPLGSQSGAKAPKLLPQLEKPADVKVKDQSATEQPASDSKHDLMTFDPKDTSKESKDTATSFAAEQLLRKTSNPEEKFQGTFLAIHENEAPPLPPRPNRYPATSDPTPPPRLKKYRSVSTGQQPMATHLITPHPFKLPPLTTDNIRSGAEKTPGEETTNPAPLKSDHTGPLTATSVETPKQRSRSYAGLLAPVGSDGNANTALHAKSRATTMHDVSVFETPESTKGKKSPTSPLSPISPSATKAKPVTPKDKEPKPHKFMYTKKDEGKLKEKEADTKAEVVSPVVSPVKKEQDVPKEVISPVEVSSPKDLPSPKEATSPKEVSSPQEISPVETVTSPPHGSRSPTASEPLPIPIGSPKEVASPKDEAPPAEVVFPDVVSTPKEVSSPVEVTSPKEIASPKEDSIAKELFPSEKDQDSKEEPSSQDVSSTLTVTSPTSPKEIKAEDKVIAAETDKEETESSTAQKLPAENIPPEKPKVTAKAKAAGPKRGNVRANMALFESKTVTPKPAVSDSGSAPRYKRLSQTGPQRSFEEASTAKPEEKAINANHQDPEAKRPSWKKPVSPPKPRKVLVPVNSQERQDEEEPEAKPLSLKDRMSKFQAASESSEKVGRTPPPWKARSNSNKDDSSKDASKQTPQKEASQQVAAEKQVIIRVADKSDKAESTARRQSEGSQSEAPEPDTSEVEKSNEKQPPSSHSCESSNLDKEDNSSPSMSNNKTAPSDETTPMKDNNNGTSDDKPASTPTTTATTSPTKPIPKKRGFIPKIERCIVCERPVYLTEMAKAEGKTFHKGCQKCRECHRTLMIGNLLLVDSQIFCKLHGTQMKNKLLKLRLDIE